MAEEGENNGNAALPPVVTWRPPMYQSLPDVIESFPAATTDIVLNGISLFVGAHKPTTIRGWGPRVKKIQLLEQTRLSQVAPFPQTLKWLVIKGMPQNFSVLPEFPAGLEVLTISGCGTLQQLQLPATLQKLEIVRTQIIEPLQLPDTITELVFSFCQMPLPVSPLPAGLRYYEWAFSGLQEFPSLEGTGPALQQINFKNNNLREVPDLDKTSLQYITLNENIGIRRLPLLPPTLQRLNAHGCHLNHIYEDAYRRYQNEQGKAMVEAVADARAEDIRLRSLKPRGRNTLGLHLGLGRRNAAGRPLSYDRGAAVPKTLFSEGQPVGNAEIQRLPELPLALTGSYLSGVTNRLYQTNGHLRRLAQERAAPRPFIDPVMPPPPPPGPNNNIEFERHRRRYRKTRRSQRKRSLRRRTRR